MRHSGPMALVSPWDSAPAHPLQVPGLGLPIRHRGAAVPTYPPGRHRGARRSIWASVMLWLTPNKGHVGRHRVGYVAQYRGRHAA